MKGWIVSFYFSDWKKKISDKSISLINYYIHFSQDNQLILLQEYLYQLTTANTLGRTTLTHDCTSASFLDIHLNYNQRQFASPLERKFLNHT